MTAALLKRKPAAASGVPVGVDNWRYSFEAVMPPGDAALWGRARWGTPVDTVGLEDTAEWTDLVWTDLTADVQGTSWRRGASEPHGRPEVGVLNVTLANDGGQWSAWNPDDIWGRDSNHAYRGPGTLIRVACHRPGSPTWVPQIAGYVESWDDASDGVDAVRWVNIVASETVARLRSIDANTRPLVGGGETAAARIRRLLRVADWGLGVHIEFDPPAPLQSTDMSMNRLAECYLVADSVDGEFRSHRSGVALFAAVDPRNHPSYQPPVAATWGRAVWDVAEWSIPDRELWPTARTATVFYSKVQFTGNGQVAGGTPPDPHRPPVAVAFDADTLATSNDVGPVVNDCRLARAGGTQQIVVDRMSSGRRGAQTYARSDLIVQTDADVVDVAEAIVARRANITLRVEGVDVDDRIDDPTVPGPNLPAAFIIDLGDKCSIHSRVNGRSAARVASVAHQVAPLTDHCLDWRAGFTFDTYEEEA